MVRNSIDCIQWFKLDKTFFNIPETIYICSTYIAPEGSPIYDIFDFDLFQKLETEIIYFQSLGGKVFILGDLNARTACKSDYVDDDRPLFRHEQNDSHQAGLIPRTSCDKGSNRFGDCLLDLCKAVDLRIVNGRVGNDFNIGKFTCFTHNGESTVDYLLTHFCNFDTLRDFIIHDFNVYSNNAPLSFNIVVNNLKYDSSDNGERVMYKWDSTYKEQFNYDTASSIENLNKKLDDEMSPDFEPDELVELFTDYLN